ncbi:MULTISPECIES: ABC transporter ATP-binding protein [unclassified Halomonas]|uniref:ABC transporter ATP-binding protein n=1 Tax=unclassified Halomonas TaxID=2609666 RepID=UPI000D1BBBE6|nr:MULTISPECIES: ABC transporter ATP-binding protein [unclassified Halomonas]
MSSLDILNATIMRGVTCTAQNISLRFEPGYIYTILGPNGTGKSSLLKAIFGEIEMQVGEICYGERQLSRRRLKAWRENIGYMPQGNEVDACLTALEVVLLGHLDALHMHIGDDVLEQALRLMQRVGIQHLAHRDIQSLSGGQRQLALFCQVLLREPKILLLDEPVSALDMHHQLSLLEHVHTETRQRGLITITVLHDLSLAAQFADRVILLGEASVKAEGTPHDVLQPALLSELYQVPVERLHDSSGMPVIRPMRQAHSPLVESSQHIAPSLCANE